MSSKIERIKALLETVTDEATKIVGPTWWKKYTQYNLNQYPTDMPETAVEVNTSGDLDTHWILRWQDPKTKAWKYGYTKGFMDAKKAEKYARTSTINPARVKAAPAVAARIFTSKADDRRKQAAAILSIIAQTGLRIGDEGEYRKTKNRGVSTLASDNITVNGRKIHFDFTGKSGMHNVADIEDGPLASYLQSKVAARSGEEFVFDVPYYIIKEVQDSIMKLGNFKIKDLRTHMAAETAKEVLNSDHMPPPPLPKDPKAIKKAVKAKLTHVFDVVSKKLNNTPAMAKNSYINPAIINDWLSKIGVQPELNSSVGVPYKDAIDEEEMVGFDGEVPVYKLPSWWDREDIELVPTGE